MTPGRYPLPPRSYLLRNDSEPGAPRFTDVTADTAPELAEAGMDDILKRFIDPEGGAYSYLVDRDGDWTGGPASLQRTSQDLAYAGTGMAFLYYLTRDPELRTLASDRQVANFAIAINRRYRTQSGEQREETTFVDVDAFGKVDIVIANAGILRDGLLVKKKRETGEIVKMSAEQWNQVLAVNLTGATFYETRFGRGFWVSEP